MAKLSAPPSGDRIRSHDPRLQAVLDDIESALARPWDPKDLHRLAGVSKSRFNRWFHFQMGMSPYAYFLKRRAHKAADDLLKCAELTDADLSTRAGFANRGAMARKFRREFGVSPEEFREGIAAGSGRPPKAA